MKLISLEIVPRLSNGLGSEVLLFGDHITQLFAPNGAGKTPLIKSIAYCLGYPSVFRADIYDRCSKAVLTIESKHGEFEISREYISGSDVDISVNEPGNVVSRFYNEQEFSEYMFDLLSLPYNTILTNRNEPTPPYLSTLLPVVYLGQDGGYNDCYCPVKSFIKDQYVEMIRVLFDIPPKHLHKSKKQKIKLDKRIDDIDRKLKIVNDDMESKRRAFSDYPLKTIREVDGRLESIEGDIESLKQSSSSHGEALSVFDSLISEQRRILRNVERESGEVAARAHGVNSIIAEINSEVETLNLNEQAKRVFQSFGGICDSGECKLFSKSSVTYSKNLLYLKDQIKDLQRNRAIDLTRVEQLGSEKQRIQESIKSLVDKRNEQVERTEMSAVLEAISELKAEAFELAGQRSDIAELDRLEKNFLSLNSDLNHLLDEKQALGNGSIPNPMTGRLRADLRIHFQTWLDAINAMNLSRDIVIDDNFRPVLGRETINQLSGSTRVRTVLAYHAALLQLLLHSGHSSMNFIILDTPKQHEMHGVDLDSYLSGLKCLCNRHGLQVIFSTTEYHYEGDGNDIEWNPQHPGDKQDMYLFATN